MGVYTIPSGTPFLAALGKGIMDMSTDNHIPLTDFRVLLSHRRACRELQNIFLNLSDGKPLLLPQIRPIGEIEEDELSLSMDGDLATQLIDIPPAIPPMRRQFLLMHLVRKVEEARTGQHISPDHALRLARALAEFMDQIILEGLSYDALDKIVPEEFAEHWKITVDFLKILSEEWPKILEAHSFIEAAERRNRLLRLQAKYWRTAQPEYPIIAAGSTGTMKATSELMDIIQSLPSGMVVLPGLDLDMDAQSWAEITPTHPQNTMKELLGELNITRADIQEWQPEHANPVHSMRQFLAREIMRPAATAEAWQNIKDRIDDRTAFETALSSIRRIECETLDEEAKIIALKLRHISEIEGRTAALVTPDRTLARQVQQICKRWNLELDDTAGSPLLHSAIGRFIILSLDVLKENFRPSVLLALLKHPLCGLGLFSAELDEAISLLERPKILRGPAPKDVMNVIQDNPIAAFFAQHHDLITALQTSHATNSHGFILKHLEFMELLAATAHKSGEERLWTGADGEAAALFFSRLLQETSTLQEVTLTEYSDIIATLLGDLIVRPKYGMHPRLMILGQIEARLVQSDVMILGGLNEGTWPPDPGNDPWMSRPMRKAFGLPDPDRAIGLSAHDFVQAFSAQEVLLTRSKRVDGSPTVPARWLERFDTVLSAAGYHAAYINDPILPHWAHILDQSEDGFSPAPRPKPCPPVDSRPTQLPVTAIEKWMRDPYSIYARYILGLRPLEPVEQDADAALKGSWLHDILSWLIETYPSNFPENIMEIIVQHVEDDPHKPAAINLWYPRFIRMMEWMIGHERTWRKTARPLLLEQEGRMQIDGLTLTAKADRIDLLHANSKLAVIDYKTGSVPKKKEIMLGLAPQLPLEALILQNNGFASVQDKHVEILSFWKLSGASEAGSTTDVEGKDMPPIAELCEQAYEGLSNLIAMYKNPATPYISLPDPDIAPPDAWQDYAQLARVSEWAALDDQEGGGNEY